MKDTRSNIARKQKNGKSINGSKSTASRKRCGKNPFFETFSVEKNPVFFQNKLSFLLNFILSFFISNKLTFFPCAHNRG
jgi:hypothetical protein